MFCTATSRIEPDIATLIQTSIKEAKAYIADCIIKTAPQTQFQLVFSIKFSLDVRYALF